VQLVRRAKQRQLLFHLGGVKSERANVGVQAQGGAGSGSGSDESRPAIKKSKNGKGVKTWKVEGGGAGKKSGGGA